MSLFGMIWSSPIEIVYRYDNDSNFNKCTNYDYMKIVNPDKVYSFQFMNCDFISNFQIELFPNIEVLSFDKVKFKDLENINIIGKCTKLKKLSFTSCNIQYLVCGLITNNIQLKYLKFDDCPHVDPSELIQLSDIKSLQELHILNNHQFSNITDISKLVNLKILVLKHNSLVNLDGIENLINIETLDIGHNVLLNLKQINKLFKLKYLYANDNNITELWTGDNTPSQLKYINLSNNNINNIKIIEECSELEVLNITNNPIKHIPNLLKLKNINYERLEIDWKKIIDVEGMKGFGLMKCIILNMMKC